MRVFSLYGRLDICDRRWEEGLDRKSLRLQGSFRKALAKPEGSPSAKVVFREALSWRGQAKAPDILSHWNSSGKCSLTEAWWWIQGGYSWGSYKTMLSTANSLEGNLSGTFPWLPQPPAFIFVVMIYYRFVLLYRRYQIIAKCIFNIFTYPEIK